MTTAINKTTTTDGGWVWRETSPGSLVLFDTFGRPRALRATASQVEPTATGAWRCLIGLDCEKVSLCVAVGLSLGKKALADTAIDLSIADKQWSDKCKVAYLIGAVDSGEEAQGQDVYVSERSPSDEYDVPTGGMLVWSNGYLGVYYAVSEEETLNQIVSL